MNEKFYLLGGTLIILIGILMPIKAVRQMLSGVTNFVIVTIVDLTVIALIGVAGYFLFYFSGLWTYSFVITNPLVNETFDSQTENLAKLAKFAVPAITLLITLIILNIRQTKLTHTTPNGYQSCLFIRGRKISLLCGLRGWVLWPDAVAHIQANIFHIRMPRTIAQEAARSSDSDARLSKEGEGFEAITQFRLRREDGSQMESPATVRVKIRLIGRLFDAGRAVDFFSLGGKSETVNLDDSKSPYRLQLEGDAVIGPALEIIRTYLAGCDLLSDVYGMKLSGKKELAAAAKEGTVRKNFLPADKYAEILQRINEGQKHNHSGSDGHTKGAKAAGFIFTDLHIEKVIPDEKTLEAMTAGLEEMKQGRQEDMDLATAENLFARLLSKQFGITKETFDRMSFDEQERYRRQLQVQQGKIDASAAGKLDVMQQGLSLVRELLPLGGEMLRNWIGSRQATIAEQIPPTQANWPQADLSQQQVKPQFGPQPNWPKKQTPPPAIVQKTKAESGQPKEAKPSSQVEPKRFLRYHPNDVKDRNKTNP